MKLAGKTAIVTGASSGIGIAIAQAFAADGARLVLTARREDRLNTVREEIVAAGGDAVVVAGDITQAATAASVTAAALKAYGGIDILVNNAGYAPPVNLVDMNEEIWDTTLDVCLKSVYLMTHAVLPTMLESGGGRIVQVSSVAGKHGYATRTAYCAAKWGIQGFSAALRDEVGDQGVRVHIVNPGPVGTEWWSTNDDAQTQEVLDRMIRVDDVARAVVYMLTQPENIQIDEVVVNTQRSPWA